MDRFTQFKITGFSFKCNFVAPTTTDATPLSWACTYSPSKVFTKQKLPAFCQTMPTYQTGICNVNKPLYRYYPSWKVLKSFGVDYANTDEYGNWSLPSADHYGGQLNTRTDDGNSVLIRVNRSETTTPKAGCQIGTVQITYYVTYKGLKSTNGTPNVP